jgi:hypothetical protein
VALGVAIGADGRRRFVIYGWIEPGGNISTSNANFNKLTGTGGNYPVAYSYQPNTIQLDQAALYRLCRGRGRGCNLRALRHFNGLRGEKRWLAWQFIRASMAA